jgi:acyl-CoA thioester hydrolase
MNRVEQVTRRVEWRDTDAAGIAHFSTFFLFMEEAEHEFLRRRGLSVFMHDEHGPFSWPRVSVSCDYQSAVKFEDVLTIDVSVEHVGTKSLTYAFVIRCGERQAATGKTTCVCCRVSQSGPPVSIEIPTWIREKLTG